VPGYGLSGFIADRRYARAEFDGSILSQETRKKSLYPVGAGKHQPVQIGCIQALRPLKIARSCLDERKRHDFYSPLRGSLRQIRQLCFLSGNG
jgi:hypothetical protein